MTDNTITKIYTKSLKSTRALEFELMDAKEEYIDIDIMLDAIFSSIDTVRKEMNMDVRTDITEDTCRGVCPVLV